MVIEFVFHHRFSAILVMQCMANFMGVKRLLLAFKTGTQVIAITQQVAHQAK